MTLPEVRVAGFLNSVMGLGETGRLITRALQGVGVPALPHVYGNQEGAHDVLSDNPSMPAEGGQHPGISLLSLNGEHLSAFSRGGGAKLFGDRYVISVWFWETEELPPHAASGLPYVDEIWAGSPFIKDLMERSSEGKTVRYFPHPVDPGPMLKSEAQERFPFENRFVFLFSFDYNSCVKRKNPQAVCEAFAKAFPHPTANGPVCVIKSINGHLNRIDQKLLQGSWTQRPDIIFLDGFLSSSDKNLLVQRADATVSLHRSEGLGLTMLESMATGKPTIGTGYSGNLAFMDEARSWLIPYEKAPVGAGSLHYPAHHEWAEPNVEAAAQTMLEVVTRSPAVQERAALGQRYVLEHHGLQRTGQFMAELLLESSTRPVSKKPEAMGPTGSWRAEAYKAMASLRQMEAAFTKFPASDIERFRVETLRLSKQHRRSLSNTLRALRHQDDQQRSRIDHLSLLIQKLSAQMEQFLSLPKP